MNIIKNFSVAICLTFTYVYAAFAVEIPTEVSSWDRVSVKTEAISDLAKNFMAYDYMEEMEVSQGAWFVLEAAHDGTFSLTSQTAKEAIDLAVFRAETIDFATELKAGTAFLLGYSTVKKGNTLKLDKNTDDEVFAPELFQVMKGQFILVFVGSNASVALDFAPELKASKTLEARKKLVPYEYRLQSTLPSLKFALRDAKTGLPVKAQINVTGLKKLDNVYNASDLVLDLVSGKKAIITYDAAGYYNAEMTGFNAVLGRDGVITVLLHPFELSENMKLNGVQFQEGTDRFLESAYKDLDKLVSFMNANTTIDIEVEGHVNAKGDNSKAAQKLSEKRAKAVRDYLIEQGIDPKRVAYVGYGNARMIYQDPQTDEQEQANRRVEVRFLD